MPLGSIGLKGDKARFKEVWVRFFIGEINNLFLVQPDLNSVVHDQYAQFVQPDRIVTGPGLPPVPASPMPLTRSDDGGWQYTNPEPQGGCESTPVPLVTLRSLRLQAIPVTDTQVGRPCPRDFDAVTVIAQKQPDGSSNYFPAPSHVRFEESDDPIILPAAVLESSE